MAETYRYDLEEDLYNDVKRHDNPNHPSYYTLQKDLEQAEYLQEEGIQEYYESLESETDSPIINNNYE